MTAEYDISNLQEKISGLTGALLGRGATSGDLQTLLKVETGQLHGAIGDVIGPKTKEKAANRIERDVKQHLTSKPDYTSGLFNGGKPMESKAYADFTWLTAGHGKNGKFLLGINNEDIQTSATALEAMRMLRVGQNGRDRGDAYQHLGWRKDKGGSGRFNILRLNRVKVSKAAYAQVLKMLMNKSGELRAAFYAVAKHYAPSIKVPGWIVSKFEQVKSNGKCNFHDSLIPGDASSFIESTIRAVGVNSNPALRQKIQGAIDNRNQKVFKKLKDVISGYKYKFATGQTFKSDITEEGVI